MPKKFSRVYVETISPSLMRYRTVGDWKVDGDLLTIQIADTGNWLFNMMVAIHEFVEAFLCVHRGVSEKLVTKFDLAHINDEDPGSHPKAPYHDEHMTALAIEMQLSTCLGIKWRPYEEVLDKTSMKVPLRKKK